MPRSFVSVAVHLAQSKISNTDASAGSSRTNHVASTCDLVSSPSFHIWIVDLGASAHVCCSRFLFLLTVVFDMTVSFPNSTELM